MSSTFLFNSILKALKNVKTILDVRDYFKNSNKHVLKFFCNGIYAIEKD